jgi:hypothetical protein
MKLGFELDFALGMQMLYHLSHSSSLFFSVILEMGLMKYLPRLTSNLNPSEYFRITSMSYWCPA